MSLLRSGYYILSYIAAPLVSSYLKARMRKGHEDNNRIFERHGHTNVSRPNKPLLWVNAVSVGEAMAALTIIQSILKLYPHIHVLLTTTTKTSAKVVEQRLPKHVTHQYCPIDTPQAVKRFLNKWQPELAIWIESELWPNLLHETQSRGIPTILLNGRMSDKSYKNWQKVRSMISPLLSRLVLCAVQSENQAKNFRALGASSTAIMGNLKLFMPPLSVDDEKYKALKKEIRSRPVWLAASTQPGEDEVVFKAHKRLKKEYPNLLTILVPRHIERGESLMKMANDEGLLATLRTENIPLKDKDIYIANTLGEMGLFYALSPVVFMGATLIPKGGHNPIEAAQKGAYVLHGPHIFNNPQLYETLHSLNLSHMIEDDSELAKAIGPWLQKPKEGYGELDSIKRYREQGLQDLMKLLSPHLKSLNEVRE